MAIVARTRLVSFPRSGHHWLLRMLRSNLGSAVWYANFYCDERTLENDLRVNLQTSHDLKLDLPACSEFQHLVQYRRDYDAAIRSLWELSCVQQAKYFDRFYERKLKFYNEWKARWVDGDVPNRLIITYEDLLDNPWRELRRAYQFLTGTEPLVLMVESPRPAEGHTDHYYD